MVLVRIIAENRVSAIPIVDQHGMPIGMVSEADVFHGQKRRTELAKANGTVASEVMTSPAITVAVDTPLSEAARTMQEKNVRSLVVVDERGCIAGIVSRNDVVQVLRTRGDDRTSAASRERI